MIGDFVKTAFNQLPPRLKDMIAAFNRRTGLSVRL